MRTTRVSLARSLWRSYKGARGDAHTDHQYVTTSLSFLISPSSSSSPLFLFAFSLFLISLRSSSYFPSYMPHIFFLIRPLYLYILSDPKHTSPTVSFRELESYHAIPDVPAPTRALSRPCFYFLQKAFHLALSIRGGTQAGSIRRRGSEGEMRVSESVKE